MATWYLDTSVLLRVILETNDAARNWISEVKSPDRIVSSRLLWTECIRALRRERLSPDTANSVLERIIQLPITEDVMVKAESIEPHIKTLDAIHLGTILSIDPSVTLVSHDTNQLKVAEHLGLQSFDPIGHY